MSRPDSRLAGPLSRVARRGKESSRGVRCCPLTKSCRIVMIQTFRDKEAERVFHREAVKKFAPAVQRAALRKLLLLDAAESLDDLRAPPGNRLEKLAGNRQGQYSIRINDRWRICFRWSGGDASDVEITDYH
jgi:proteic killer suppression protein